MKLDKWEHAANIWYDGTFITFQIISNLGDLNNE